VCVCVCARARVTLSQSYYITLSLAEKQNIGHTTPPSPFEHTVRIQPKRIMKIMFQLTAFILPLQEEVAELELKFEKEEEEWEAGEGGKDEEEGGG